MVAENSKGIRYYSMLEISKTTSSPEYGGVAKDVFVRKEMEYLWKDDKFYSIRKRKRDLHNLLPQMDDVLNKYHLNINSDKDLKLLFEYL